MKDFYEELFLKKKTKEYKEKVRVCQKDFLHKYLLFFLNPYKYPRHEIVKAIIPAGERYLDIGCWNGDSTISYGVKEKFHEIYGIDITESGVQEARKKGINAYIVDVNFENLPFFEDNFFDVITFVAVIEHLVDPYHILEEIKRVMKPKGVLIIGTANVASLSNRLRVLFGHRPRTSFDDGWDGGHLLYFTPKDLAQLLYQYGFEIIGKRATGNLQLLRKILFNMTGEFIFICSLNK